MDKNKETAYKKIIASVAVVVISVLAFLIMRPFIVAILSAAALSYIFYPFYLMILGKFKKSAFMPLKTLAAMLTCFVIILIVLIPTAIMTSILTYELRNGYLFLQELIKSPEWTLPSIPHNALPFKITQENLKGPVIEVFSQLLTWLQKVVKSIPNYILNIFVTVFSTYYFLKHGKDLYEFFKSVIPFSNERYKQIIERFDDISRGMIVGQIVVGIVQGILAWLGFWFLGVSNPVLLGFLTAVISIIPLLGAAIVWVPVDIYLFITGYFTGDYFRAIALLIYGTLVISLIDNILKPKIVGENAKIHPLIILFGILGGIQLFGLPGILIGPLVLTLFDLVIEIYRESL